MATGLPNGASPTKTGDHFEMHMKALPAFVRESYMPPEHQMKPRLEVFYFDGNRSINDYWDDAGHKWSKTIERFIGDSIDPARRDVETDRRGQDA